MYSFYTKLDMEECKTRLNAVVQKNRFKTVGIRGNVCYSRDCFHLISISSHYRSSTSRYFYGKMIKTDEGTIIKGSFHMHNFVRLFLAVWFGCLLCAAGNFTLGYLSEIPSEKNPFGLLMTLIMILFGVVLGRSGAWLGKKQENDVLCFLKSTLHLQEDENTVLQ